MGSAAASEVRNSPTGCRAWSCSSSWTDSFRGAINMRRLVALGGAGILAALALGSAPVGAPSAVNDGHGDYVYVPAGAFRMGDNFGDGDARERPVHVVDLD